MNQPSLFGQRFWVFSALICMVMWSAAAPGVRASLDREIITLGETATLSLAFSGGTPATVPNLILPQHLQWSYVGQSSQTTIFNGQVNSTVTYSFRLTPKQEGDFSIPAITVTISGAPVSTDPLVLKVQKPSSPTAQDLASGSQIAFVKLIAPKKKVFVGETLVVQLHLYLRRGVQNVRSFELTAFPSDGFLVGKMAEGQRTETQVNRSIYTVIPLLFPIKALRLGNLTLGPATATAVLDLPVQGRGRDPFFDSFFGNVESRQFSLVTESEQMDVQPLPEQGVPWSFNGAVGSFEMMVNVGPTNVAVGDPITVKVRISGKGPIESLNLPDQHEWGSFRTYPPTSRTETADPLGLQGTKYFEQVVLPEDASVKELPALEFSYFDVSMGTYRTLKHPPTPLVVRPVGPALNPIPGKAKTEEVGEADQDIVHIKQRLGPVAHSVPPLITRPWFLILQALPVLVYFASLVWRKQTEQLANNPRLRRARETTRIVDDCLKDLKTHAARSDSEKFFTTITRILQEQLGERLHLPASAITEAVIEEKCRPKGFDEITLQNVHELFQASDLARFAPVKTSQELAVYIPKVQQVVKELRQIKL